MFAHKYSDRNDQQEIKKFEPTDASLQTYIYPKWFTDAKFGIWAVWGPCSVPKQGDWQKTAKKEGLKFGVSEHLAASYTWFQNAHSADKKGPYAGIQKYPWQTDTSIGDWVFRENDKYKTATQIIQMLVDIVSKNGNLLLNVAPKPDGTLDSKAIKTLKDIGVWLKDNGDAIYGSKPWYVYGEGPSVEKKQKKGQFQGVKDVRPYSNKDIRFTTKDDNIYVFVMKRPYGKIIVNSSINKTIKSVKLLNTGSKVKFSHKSGECLIIDVPKSLPSYEVVVFQINL